MKMYEIFNKEVIINKDKYNFIIEEQHFEEYSRNCRLGRIRPKFYTIKKNNEIILHTSLHQTFYARKRQIIGE